ncbi:MAG: DUF4097 family beta strand repeat-containing protein [Pseudomonadota bacterium]
MTNKWMLLVAALLSTAAFAAPATQFSKQVPVGNQDWVTVSNVAGSVTITTWDRREVDVQGELGSDVERVEVNQQTGNVEVRVVVKEGNWFNSHSSENSQTRLQIKVPADVQPDVNTVSANITVSGVRGKLRLQSVSGDIRSDFPGSDLEAKTVSGNIELTGGNAEARVRATSVSGNVRAAHIKGDVDARTVSGNLDFEMLAAGEVRGHTVSGNIGITGGLASDTDVELQSVSGRVKVAAQAPAGYRYDVSSFSGNIRNCFGYEVEKSQGRSNRMNGVRGEGKGSVSVKSHSGGVELCDR